ncbi:MAG TPA: hypothetical protein VHH92_00375 [Actinomycetota bacterium]|nr:hypothetical protein [Actinomycetota bacterium]
MVFDGYEQIRSKKRPIDGQITELVSHTVTSVASDGSAVIEVAVEKIRGSVGPERAINLERAGTPTVRMVVAPDGRLLQVEGVLAAFVGQIRAADADPMKVWSDPVGGGGVDGMQPFPLLPDQPVGPGDEWETDFQLPLGIGRHVIDVHTESRLLRYERIDGVRTAVIKARAEYPIDVAIDWSLFAREYGGSPVPYEDLDRLPSTLSYTGTTGWVQTTWLDPELGRLVRARGSAEFDVTAEFEGGGPRIRRLLAEKASLHVVGGMKIAVRRVAP